MNYLNNSSILCRYSNPLILAAHLDSLQVSNQSREAIVVSMFYLLGGLEQFSFLKSLAGG